MRVVLYAEGPGELRQGPGLPPEPNSVIAPEAWGAGHHLVRRTLELLGQDDTSFAAPFRVRGRPARGSDLVDVETLRRLCTWFHPERMPDLVVILVDEDGHKRRRKELTRAVGEFSSPPSPHAIVVAVARQEFESWLISDPGAVSSASGQPFRQPQAPESLRAGHAKETLQRHLVDAGKQETILEVRTEIAKLVNLGLLQRSCGSFKSFLKDLRDTLT